MNKIFLSISIVTIFSFPFYAVSGISDEPNEKKYQVFYSTGQLKEEGPALVNGKITSGIYKSYFIDGKLKKKITVVDNVVSKEEEFNNDGNIVLSLAFEDNGNAYTRTKYYDNGNKEFIQQFRKIEIRYLPTNFRRHGTFTEFNEDGTLYSETNYEIDLEHGYVIEYENNKAISKWVYKQGQLEATIFEQNRTPGTVKLQRHGL